MARLSALGRTALAVMLALSLSLPTPALAWAASGDLLVGSVSGAAVPAEAEPVGDEVWDGSVDVSWYVDSPDAETYTLTTPAQLAGLAALVNGTSGAIDDPLTFKGRTVKLGNDIWLNAEPAAGYDSTNTQRVWTPIGDLELLGIDPDGSEGAMPHYGDGRYFDGTLDGDGHVVKNLYIYRNEEGTYGGVQALFANVGGNAVIRNVGVDGGWVMGRVAAGLVAISHATEGNFPHIIGCFNTADITGNGSTTRGVAGIFAGEEQYRAAAEGQEENYHGGAYIANCYNAGTISAYTTSSPSAGGIAGTGSVQMYGCYNVGDVQISSRYAGSLAGCLIAPGYPVGQGKGAFDGDSVVSDTYTLADSVPADDQALVKLYNMIDADHPKGDVDRDSDGVIIRRNPAVTASDTAGFKPASWFKTEDAWREMSHSFTYVKGADAPRLYWQEGLLQLDLQKMDDYGQYLYELSDIPTQPYTGSALEPQVVITYDASAYASDPDVVYLHEGSDFIVAYSDNVEKGTAGVAVTGMGRFYNGRSTSFDIIGSDLSEASIGAISAQWWYGPNTVKPSVAVYATNGDKLVEGTDYTVTLTGVPEDEAGFTDGKATAEVTISSIDQAKFTGTTKASFTVLQASTHLDDADADGYYELSSKGDLQYLAYVTSGQVSAETVDLWSTRNFELTANIDARAHCDEGDTTYLSDRAVDPLYSYYYKPFEEAADAERVGGFGGTFDGAGHTVTLGLTEAGLSLDPDTPLGMFVYTKYKGAATFKNLVIDGSVKAPDGVAACLLVMAQPGTVTVENCTNNATATGNRYVYGSAAGFIVESALSDSTEIVMRNCTNNGRMKSAARAAGFVGALGAKSATFENCTNTGAIEGGSTGGAGGIVALVLGASSVDAAFSEISFAKCTNTGAVSTKSADAGGMVGWNQDPVRQISFSRCANRGSVLYGGAGCCGAGIIGRTYSPVSILNCYNNAKIGPRNSANRPAGIVGYAGVDVPDDGGYGDIVLRNVYSAGGFSSEADEAGGVVGIVWLHNRLTFDNVYYETGAGCATKEIGFNFADDWGAAVDPPIVVGECVQADTAAMKDATFASMLGTAFAPDEVDASTQGYANDGFPVLSDIEVNIFDLSVAGAYTVKGDDTVAYTGAPLQIDNLSVEDSAGQALEKGVDYVVFYTAEGTKGTAIVQGIGSYTGSIEKSFAIVPCDIATCKGIQVLALDYSEVAGGQAKQVFSLKSPAGTALTEGADYEAVYANNTAPGLAYVLVRGKAPYYTGTVLRTFTIGIGDLSKVRVEGIEAHYPAGNMSGGLYVYEQLVTNSGYVLERSDSPDEGNDYVRVFYEYNEATGAYDLPVRVDGSHDEGKAWANHLEKAGSYRVELRGEGTSTSSSTGEVTQWTNGYWSGTASATFTYGNRMASDEDVTVAGVQPVYGQTGSDLAEAVKPVLTNGNTGYPLSEGTDYTLAYQLYDEVSGAYETVDQVIDAGRYKVAITGRGSWFGTREVAFQVVPSQFFIADDTVVEGIDSQYFYTGEAISPQPTSVSIAYGDEQARTLRNSDYTVSYTDSNGVKVSEPVEEGTYYAVIAGAGAYRGTKRVAFSITKPYFVVNVRHGDGAANVVKRYTKEQFSALAAPDATSNPVSALYCDASGSNWSVASSGNYVLLSDLLSDAGVNWAQNARLTYAAGGFTGKECTYEQLQTTMFYPATTAHSTDLTGARRAPFVLSITDASTSIGGANATFAAEAEEENLIKASAETAPRALMGVQQSDYENAQERASEMRGNRLVKGVDSITVTLPESDDGDDGGESGSDNPGADTSGDSTAGKDGGETGNPDSGKPGSGSSSSNGKEDGRDSSAPSSSSAASQAENGLTASGKTVSVTFKAKKAQTVARAKAITLAGAQGEVRYQKVSGTTKVKVTSTGKFKVAKRTPVGTYRIKTLVSAAGDVAHAAKSLTVTTVVKVKKAKNPLFAKAKARKVSAAKLAVGKRVLKKASAFKVSKAVGKVTFKKISGNKSIVVSKAGKVTVKKGLPKGTYRVKVRIHAAGNANYKPANKLVTLRLKVK